MIDELLGDGAYIGVQNSDCGFMGSIEPIKNIEQDRLVVYSLKGIIADTEFDPSEVPLFGKTLEGLFNFANKYETHEEFVDFLVARAMQDYERSDKEGNVSRPETLVVNPESVKLKLKEDVSFSYDGTRVCLRVFELSYVASGTVLYGGHINDDDVIDPINYEKLIAWANETLPK